MISKGELCNRGPEKDVLHAFTYRTRGGIWLCIVPLSCRTRFRLLLRGWWQGGRKGL